MVTVDAPRRRGRPPGSRNRAKAGELNLGLDTESEVTMNGHGVIGSVSRTAIDNLILADQEAEEAEVEFLDQDEDEDETVNDPDLDEDAPITDKYPVPEEDAFADAQRKGVTHIDAPEPARIAFNLIRDCEEFEDLRRMRVRYMWRKRGGSSAGQPVLARTLAPRGLLREVLGADFLITLSADHIREAALSSMQIEALIYHHLRRAGITTDGEARVMAPEFTAFASEVERYGAWRPALKSARRAFALEQGRFEI